MSNIPFAEANVQAFLLADKNVGGSIFWPQKGQVAFLANVVSRQLLPVNVKGSERQPGKPQRATDLLSMDGGYGILTDGRKIQCAKQLEQQLTVRIDAAAHTRRVTQQHVVKDIRARSHMGDSNSTET